jgi:hypothetical protein
MPQTHKFDSPTSAALSATTRALPPQQSTAFRFISQGYGHPKLLADVPSDGDGDGAQRCIALRGGLSERQLLGCAAAKVGGVGGGEAGAGCELDGCWLRVVCHQNRPQWVCATAF